LELDANAHIKHQGKEKAVRLSESPAEKSNSGGVDVGNNISKTGKGSRELGLVQLRRKRDSETPPVEHRRWYIEGSHGGDGSIEPRVPQLKSKGKEES